MNQKEKLKLFISYSHKNEEYIKRFITHISPLKSEGLIKDWYDRKITAGKDFQNEIENKLEDADIICLFISADFLASNACIEELNKASRLGILIIPIILSECAWRDDKKISKLLALPTDGKPIAKFEDKDEAWLDVYKGLKIAIEEEIKIKRLKLTDNFSTFLQSIELLTKAHSQKDKVFLEDIFIYPELYKFNKLKKQEKKIGSDELIKNFYDYPKILIAGENQAGKTTLCKKIFIKLREKNFIPIYISYDTNPYQANIEKKILNACKEQYETIAMEEIDKERIIPIIDNFHFIKNKENQLNRLSDYKRQILIADDIFSLNFKNQNLINSFTHFKIVEFSPLLRNKLIKKWMQITDKKNGFKNENTRYQIIDEKTELVDSTLGKIFGNGVMPAYPFFILAIISSYEAFNKPLDQDITSQGYCYQALIYIYLRKQGVKNDEVDTYINFLTEFAFFFYSEKKNEISDDEFKSFMESYIDKYNLPIEQDILLTNLNNSNIIGLDNFGNYNFYYKYLYYFFVGKYFAEHATDTKDKIDNIINNLHKDENAYIAIFVSHHSNNNYVLDEILVNAYCLFETYKPATLNREDTSFFDKQEHNIIKAALPPVKTTPEHERDKRLLAQDIEEQYSDNTDIEPLEEENDVLEIELRRSIKTVEVMGCIIKNRAGSLVRERLEEIFKEAANVVLRMLTFFFEVIKYEKGQEYIIQQISIAIKKIIDNENEKRKTEGREEKEFTENELKKIAEKMYWNISFFYTFAIINKIIHSVGSKKLTNIIKKVCDNENTPAFFLIKHGILMWYNKNIQVDNIAKQITNNDCSAIGRIIMDFMIVNHCILHKMDYKEREKIERLLGIDRKKLLLPRLQKDEDTK